MTTYTSNSHAQLPNGDIAPFTGIAVSWQTNTMKYRVRPNAVVRTLREAEIDRKRRGGQMLWPVLSEHSPALAFGWIASAEITEDGFYVTGYLDATTPECQKAFQAATDGRVNGLSIGFKTIAEHLEGDVRVLDEIEIVEISVGADPVDVKARMSVKGFSDLEHSMMRAIQAEQRQFMSDDARTLADIRARLLAYGDGEETMDKHTWVDDDDYERPLYEGSYSQYQEPDRGYRIDYNNPDENPANFERAWRAELREDDDIWLLTDKNRVIELQRRDQERRQKQAAQHEALLKDRKERAEARPDMTLDWTPEAFAAKLGLDPVWMRRLFSAYADRGVVELVDKDTMMLHGSDVQRIAIKEAEAFEFQAIKARNKRVQGKVA